MSFLKELGGFLSPIDATLHRLPVSALYFAYSVTCCEAFRNKYIKRFWFAALVASFFKAFAGDFVTASLLGTRPDPLITDLALGLHLLAFWLMLYSPGNAFFRLYEQPLLNAIFNLLSTTTCVQAICHTVDTGARVYSESYGTPILLGTLMGCAGKFAGHAIVILGLDDAPRPGDAEHHAPEMSSPTFASRSALMTAGAYAALSWSRALPPAAAEGLMLVLLNAHALVNSLLDADFDATESIAGALHALTGVPLPGLEHYSSEDIHGPAVKAVKEDHAQRTAGSSPVTRVTRQLSVNSNGAPPLPRPVLRRRGNAAIAS